ncbi:MAG: ABC transporter permease subunit, partial [Bdellovibrionota bacterium]
MSRGRWAAGAWIGVWFTAAVVAGFRAGDRHYELSRMLLGPSPAHWFGFDAFGRDLLELTLRSSLWSAGFALGCVGIACGASAILGCAMAASPPRAQFWSLRGLEFFLAFPSLLFALMVAAIRGPGWITLSVALLLSVLPSFVRLIHARALEVLAEDYVLAARSFGAG